MGFDIIGTKHLGPDYRAVDALSGDITPSPVLGILSTAEHIHQGLTDNARLARDNEKLREQLDALLDTDKGELVTRNEELKAEVDTLTGKLIAAHDDLASLRNERSSWRDGIPVVKP